MRCHRASLPSWSLIHTPAAAAAHLVDVSGIGFLRQHRVLGPRLCLKRLGSLDENGLRQERHEQLVRADRCAIDPRLQLLRGEFALCNVPAGGGGGIRRETHCQTAGAAAPPAAAFAPSKCPAWHSPNPVPSRASWSPGHALVSPGSRKVWDRVVVHGVDQGDLHVGLLEGQCRQRASAKLPSVSNRSKAGRAERGGGAAPTAVSDLSAADVFKQDPRGRPRRGSRWRCG